MFGHVNSLCEEFIRSDGLDPLFLIWSGLSLAAQGKTTLGLSQIDKIMNKTALALPIAVAQLSVHKMVSIPDHAAIGELESEVENQKRIANSSASIQAAQIFWLCNEVNTAIDLIQPLISSGAGNRAASALYGWIKLSIGDKDVGKFYESETVGDPFLTYGRAIHYATAGKFSESLQTFVQLAQFPEAHLEKARICISMNRWELALEAVQESQGKCVSNFEFHFISAVYAMTFSGDLDSARTSALSAIEILKKYESSTPFYFARICEVLYGLCWNDRDMVSSLLGVVEKVPHDNPVISSILGTMMNAIGRYKDAIDCFQTSLTFNPENKEALYGLVIANMKTDQNGDALNYLDLLEAAGDAMRPSLIGVLARCIYNRATDVPVEIEVLLEAMEQHLVYIVEVQNAQPEIFEIRFPLDQYFEKFLEYELSIFSAAVSESLYYCTTLERTVVSPQNGRVCDLIAKMIEYVPGSIPFSYYLAVLAFGEGRYPQATRAIQSVLNSKWGFNASQCHLLLAQIQLHLKQFDESEKSLDRAVSNDFNIRQSLRYQMLSAQLQDARGQFTKASETIEELKKSASYRNALLTEQVNVNIFLARSLRRQGKNKEAVAIIEDTVSQWGSTPEYEKIILFKASLLAKVGRPLEGLEILNSFAAESSNYTLARKKASKIYLQKMNDKANYLSCFRQLVNESPTKANFILLAEAYAKTKLFDDSVEAYKAAKETDDQDPQVALDYARSLMTVHRYDDAMKAYMEAIQLHGSGLSPSFFEYCNALFQLRKHEEVKKRITQILNDIGPEQGDWENQFVAAELQELLSNVEHELGNEKASRHNLLECIDTYEKLAFSPRIDISAEIKRKIKEKVTKALQRASYLSFYDDDKSGAIEYLQRAVAIDSSNTQVLYSLARIHLSTGRIDQCQEMCQQILRLDSQMEDAAILLAEVSTTETVNDLEAAFTRNPTFYRTLIRLIEKCARAGDLTRIPSFFEKIENKENPGFFYAKGLYHFLVSAPQDALTWFNRCRKDPVWGQSATAMIFNIYINPNKKYVWNEERPLATTSDIETAQKLLHRLTGNTSLLEANLYLSQNTTESVQRAIQIYNKADQRDLNVLLGLCRCYLRLNQVKDAARQLNLIIHTEPTNANYSVFVEAFLMMSHISYKDEDMVEAEKYVYKAIELDQSNGKAWEMIGIFLERKKNHSEAAVAFQKSWDISSHSNLGVGFKLASNHLKAGNPVESIKVCRMILTQRPNYPRLKQSIFIPACQILKT